MYDGTLSPTDQTELVAWATLFWQRMDQGGGSPGEGFAFTNPAMNSQLFNPLRAARPTLEKVGLMRSDDCDQMGVLGADGVPEIASVWEAYRKAMLDGKIETDWSSDPSGTIEHVNLILAAPASAGLTVYVEGGKLVSQNLPLEKVDQTAYEATLKFGASQQTQDIIAALIASGAQWAADAGNVTEAQKAVAGQPSKVDNFAATVQQFIRLVESGGASPSGASVVTAEFGVYGSLPIVVVQLNDCKVLIDSTNGNLSGPFTLDSKVDATGLLAVHSEHVAGTGVQYFDRNGCPAPLAVWLPIYPGWPFPPSPTPRPAVPGSPTPIWVTPPFAPAIPVSPVVPGWNSPPACFTNALPPFNCICDVHRQFLRGTTLQWVRERYTCPAAPAPCPPASLVPCGVPSTDYWW